MKVNSSDTLLRRQVQPSTAGVVWASLGVLAFSFSFPATVWSLEGFGPWSTASLRGVLAAALAGTALLVSGAPLPRRSDWGALVVVALGCAIGFPLLTTLALQTSSTAHSAVVIGALPMATASLAAWRHGTRHTPRFWAAAATGALAVLTFTIAQSDGLPTVADLYLLVALLLCAAGYVAGGQLSARMPGWQVIAWGLLLALPVNLLVAGSALTSEPVRWSATAVGGLLYVAAVSQFLGFVAWYHGMSLIGVARASQLQLAQPLLTLVWAVLLMGESLPPAVPLTAVVVLVCIVLTQRERR